MIWILGSVGSPIFGDIGRIRLLRNTIDNANEPYGGILASSPTSFAVYSPDISSQIYEGDPRRFYLQAFYSNQRLVTMILRSTIMLSLTQYTKKRLI